MKFSPERKLKYLAAYMEEYIDAIPNKIKPFNSWLDSRTDKAKNRGKHEAIKKYKSICRYCKSPFEETGLLKTKDHVIPLSKGGLDKKENRVPCCFECNQWKSDKMPNEWLAEVGKLMKSNKQTGDYSHQKLAIMYSNIRQVHENVKANYKKASIYKIQ